MSRALGDDRGVAWGLLGLGRVAMWQGEYDFCFSLYEECLAIGRRLGDRRVISNALSMIGVILMRKQEYRAARSSLEEALAIQRELGNDADIASTLTMRGSVAIHLGEYEQAKALIEESLGIARELGAESIIAFCLARLGMIALRLGDPQHAEAFLMEGLARAQDSGLRRWSRWYLVGLAEIAWLRGMGERAAKLIGASESVASAAGAHYEPATNDEIVRIVASVRAELDEEAFARLSAEGRAMSLKEVVTYAGEPDSPAPTAPAITPTGTLNGQRSEEHTSELQSPCKLVCRLLLEKTNRPLTAALRPFSARSAAPHKSPLFPYTTLFRS